MRRDRVLERLLVLPFSSSCVSVSSTTVAVTMQEEDDHPVPPSQTPPQLQPNSSSSGNNKQEDESWSMIRASSSSYSTIGFWRLIKGGIKTISSRLFVYKQEEMEMEIGFPTGVKHVTHIGVDGGSAATTTSSTILLNNIINNNHPQPGVSLHT